MGVFHVFRIVQIVQNRAKHQILSKEELIKKFNHLKWKLNTLTFHIPGSNMRSMTETELDTLHNRQMFVVIFR